MRHDIVLEGYGITLRPLALEDADALAPVIDRELWAYMPPPFPEGLEGWRANIASGLDDPARLPFAVTDSATDAVLGSTSFYDLSEGQRRVEVGYTFYGRTSWGGRVNPACKRLLLGHAFEVWGLARVALRCDADNARSAAAIRKLGAQPEGRLRNHRRRPDGTQGDTLYFSIIDTEWASVRASLDERLR
ncbi:MAG TPA: GNAT family protein [Mycobacteriales bacterium]|nr:GNAT family protein [Mycobacteriales bacterium]